MNILELKAEISPIDVARRYIGKPEKERFGKLWYMSPFRAETNPSFVVSSKGFHDFGESWHADIISFVQRYYGLSFKGAVELLMQDFNILPNEYETETIKNIKKKQREQRRKKEEDILTWFNGTYNFLCDLRAEWLDIAEDYKGDLESNVYALAIDKLCTIDYWLDVFMEYSKDKGSLYERREDVACSLM